VSDLGPYYRFYQFCATVPYVSNGHRLIVMRQCACCFWLPKLANV